LVAGFLASPRARRRLAWLAAFAAVALGIVAVVLSFPNTDGRLPDRFTNEPVQRVVVEKQVPVTPARRAEINALFDAFVPAAVERADPASAFDLVTPEFRGDGTRADWAKGNLPVFPYEPRGASFHGWTVDTSYRTTMSVQLDLQPRDPKEGAVDYSVDLRRVHGRWLIDSFYPQKSYAPSARPQTKTTASPEAPHRIFEPDRSAHANLMWIVILGFLGLVLAVPICLVAASWLSTRRSRSDA
jgi:hypothetical protein